MDRIDKLICKVCNECFPEGRVGGLCDYEEEARQKFFELVRSFLPERKPVMSGEPCEWNDCLDEIEKNIKKRR